MVIKMNIWKTTTICIIVGFILDMILGDPYWLPHPIRLIGREITVLEQFLYRKTEEKKGLLIRGGILAVIVMVSTLLTSGVILFFSYHIHEFVGMAVESIMCYQVLAAKCLKVESMKVYQALAAKDTQAARKAVSMIVGRDTAVLDENGITKAAVETVAENTSDGVIAPLFYLCLGGPVLAFLYKSINTMDSMIGYKNDRYLYFGRVAAKIDDIVNYIPARLSACLMILSSFILGMDGKGAYRIHKRDCRKHASPNAGQTEAVCAGALQIRLAGDAVYFGKVVKKPYIGDDIRPVAYEDIKKANRLLYATAVCMLLSGVLIRSILYLLVLRMV